MVIDVHCHVGYSARRIDPAIIHFDFESDGAAAHPGYDSYFSPRLLQRIAWFFVKRMLKIDPRLQIGPELDARIEAVYQEHFWKATGVDRLVLLAFDEYRNDAGRAIGPVDKGVRFGSDLYVSNSLVRAMCAARPDRYLFGASIHPYRPGALAALEEVVRAGAVLVKWLPIHQNMSATDDRTVAFLRRAAELNVAMLIHYGGEMSLSRQHMEFESALPMLGVLRDLRAEGRMPTTIVAHVATPSFRWHCRRACDAFVEALLGEFRDAPIYADISALAAFGRTSWLRRFARRRELHAKLVWGSDFPIPVMRWPFSLMVSGRRLSEIRRMPSWIEQDLQLKRALGFDEGVFTRAADLLRVR